MIQTHPLPTNLDLDDIVQLFPTIAYRESVADDWRLLVQGDVSSPGKVGFTKKLLLRLLQRMMRATSKCLQGEIFQSRIQRFLATSERGKSVVVRVGDHLLPVPGKSGPTGHFSSVVRLPPTAIAANDSASPATVPLHVQFAQDDSRSVQAPVHLLQSRGLSIISDIDDTLKHSYVLCRRTLLQNTFLNEFEVIPGMADVFRGWANEGAAFHYVSSSPWQLYEHLESLLSGAGFPIGSYHLRCFRLRDQIFRRLLLLRRSGKLQVIASLVRMLPGRRFVLVGDSGEHDPEVYGAIARRFPQQIERVLIREMPGPKSTLRRYERAFRQLPAELWQIYRRPNELPASFGDVPEVGG